MIEIQNVYKQFSGNQILKGIDLIIPDKSIFGIIGLSGAGKTTLLRCLHALEQVDEGQIIIDGLDIQKLTGKKKLGYQSTAGMIFQHFNLLESKSVYDNVALPLKLQGLKKEQYHQLVIETLEFVGLEEHVQKYPNELSGGQKQRVGIARALVHKPKLLLCDEATSALDPQTSQTILALLKKVNEVYGITIVLITHQMEVIRNICSNVALMENGQIVETGEVFDIFTNPQTPLAKTFINPVLQQDLPEVMRLQLLAQKRSCYKLTFIKGHADEPVLSQITQKNDVQFNILFGGLSEVQSRFFGQLTVEFLGDDARIEQSIRELNALDVTVQKVDLTNVYEGEEN
ncbi:MAG: methionine ABC transporter ATP-binding protein [Culicoidibacterales bacterium]